MATATLTAGDVHIIEWVVKKAIEGARTQTSQTKREYYSNTERLLYSFEKLKVKIETDKQDIEDLKAEQHNTSTWHEIRPQEGPDLDDEVRHMQKVRNRERAMLRTLKMIERVERNLKIIEDDQYYQVIPKIYFQKKVRDEVAKEMFCSTKTVRRHQKRLINDLSILFYGADALGGGE